MISSSEELDNLPYYSRYIPGDKALHSHSFMDSDQIKSIILCCETSAVKTTVSNNIRLKNQWP